jgi:hypothetical protein
MQTLIKILIGVIAFVIGSASVCMTVAFLGERTGREPAPGAETVATIGVVLLVGCAASFLSVRWYHRRFVSAAPVVRRARYGEVALALCALSVICAVAFLCFHDLLDVGDREVVPILLCIHGAPVPGVVLGLIGLKSKTARRNCVVAGLVTNLLMLAALVVFWSWFIVSLQNLRMW